MNDKEQVDLLIGMAAVVLALCMVCGCNKPKPVVATAPTADLTLPSHGVVCKAGYLYAGTFPSESTPRPIAHMYYIQQSTRDPKTGQTLYVECELIQPVIK